MEKHPKDFALIWLEDMKILSISACFPASSHLYTVKDLLKHL
jgi:hypothetical protein